MTSCGSNFRCSRELNTSAADRLLILYFLMSGFDSTNNMHSFRLRERLLIQNDRHDNVPPCWVTMLLGFLG